MLDRSAPPSAIHFQQAGYIVAAAALGITLRPTRLTILRRYADDVFDVEDNVKAADADGTGMAIFEKMALVMLAGTHALQRFAPSGWDRSGVEARELVWCALEEYEGYIKEHLSALREFNIRVAELSEEARTFVAQHDDLARTANDLAVTARK
jgi:hypothetical protein